MLSRPVIALSATLALLGAGSAAGAVGDPADGPAAGAATTTLTLLDVGLGDTSLSLLELALRSDRLSGAPTTAVVVTPLTVGSTSYGQQSLSSRSAALPGVDTTTVAPSVLSGLATVRSPLVDVTVAGGSSRAGTTSLGSVSVLGMPLSMQGELSLTSTVDAAGAQGGKTLVVRDLALPSLADVLAALGLDLRTLPTRSLSTVLDRLDLDSTLLSDAQATLEQVLAPVQPQLAPAQEAVTQLTQQVVDALAQVEASRTALASATTTLNEATSALSSGTGFARRGNLLGLDPVLEPVTSTLDPVLAPVTSTLEPVLEPVTSTVEPVLEPVTSTLEPVTQPVTELVQDTVAPVLEEPLGAVEQALDTVTTAPVVESVVEALPALPEVLPLPTLPSEIPLSLQPVVDAYTAAKTAYDAALQEVGDAQASLDALDALLKDAVAKVAAVLAPYQSQVDALVDAAIGLLDATPLVSLDRLEITTRSAATSAESGGQAADVIGGEVEGLRVLGTDVLQSVTGSSQLGLLDLTSAVSSRVDSAIGGLTGAVSTALTQVPGLPTLQVPAPTIGLLARATSTDVVDGFGVAGSAVRAVSVSWPSLSIPAAAALPSASTLPGVAGATTTLSALRRGSLVTATGDILSQPLTLSLATLEDRARFRPALLSLQPGTSAPGTGVPTSGLPTTGAPTTSGPTTGSPTTGTPTSGTPTTGTPTTGTPGSQTPPTVGTGQQLPRTGLDSVPSVLALLLVAAALVLHRRYRTA